MNMNLTCLDQHGSLISGVRLNPKRTYLTISSLLQQYLNQQDSTSWDKITHQIDYLYDGLVQAMIPITKDGCFIKRLHEHLSRGKKLVFKPNIIAPLTIDPMTHGSVEQVNICTEWAVTAAVMRWFHDCCDINYASMALAESSTMASTLAISYSQDLKEHISTEAIFEGHDHSLYGGWGFYFVRQYLSLHRRNNPYDNPMNGFEESCSGTYLPPGAAPTKLMVYDINNLQSHPSRGRSIPVPGGQNFSHIMLHKVIVGGSPDAPADMQQYPGCILINLPKLKMHGQDLITNAIKNIGIGLYPSLCAVSDKTTDTRWRYASPDSSTPNLKAKLPHSPNVMEMDETTHLPKLDASGNYIIHHTKGFNGTELDIIKAVQSQGVPMLHICDCIHPLNLNHDHGNLSQTSPEGYLWISEDCVALDYFCARYCFKTVSREMALCTAKYADCDISKSIRKCDSQPEFLQKVPVVIIKNHKLTTCWQGFDSPLLRYDLYQQAEKRGIGCCNYHIKGQDFTTGCTLASSQGHLVSVQKTHLQEMMTNTLFYNTNTILHDLQATLLSYAKANDCLCKSSPAPKADRPHANQQISNISHSQMRLYDKIMHYFDSNHDGIIDYNEKGRGYENAQFGLLSQAIYSMYTQPDQYLKSMYDQAAMYVRFADKKNNPLGHDFLKEKYLLSELYAAYLYSQQETEIPDPNLPGNTYGKGNWPCYATVQQLVIFNMLYGSTTSQAVTLTSLYGIAFQYSDKISNQGAYTGSINQKSSQSDSLQNYFLALKQSASPLPFTLYIPVGFSKLDDRFHVPNVVETQESDLLYTIEFHLANGKTVVYN